MERPKLFQCTLGGICNPRFPLIVVGYPKPVKDAAVIPPVVLMAIAGSRSAPAIVPLAISAEVTAFGVSIKSWGVSLPLRNQL